ncbi:MAG: hypothetical protein JNK63_04345 [Chthonomonas sp.]|nr:hypothetical protein [Chthonomonas sp.]
MRAIALSMLFACALAHAQMPDFSIYTDLRMQVHSSEGDVRPRLFDPFARISTVRLAMIFEGFYRLSLSERFTRIPSDNSSNQLEHFYVELPGVWRLGHLDTKFGRGWLIREYGLGGEFNTNLLIDNLPITIAAIDDGGSRSRGVIGRVGGKVGLSFGSGHHLAASGTSLAAIRRPEEAPGLGRGYDLLFGLDAAASWRDFRVLFEYAGLRRGSSPLDEDEDVLDLEFAYRKNERTPEFKLGYARALQARTDHLRAEVEMPIDDKLSLTGQFRVDRGSKLLAFGVHFRF